MQGQIGAQVYHQNGTLTIGPPALELQPLADYPGENPDIDGRGDYVVIGSTVYQRVNSLNEWRVSSVGAGSPVASAHVKPATRVTKAHSRFPGECKLRGCPT